MSSPFDQSMYQIRLEWGIAGLERLAPADIVVVVDVLRFSSTVIRSVAGGTEVALDADAHAVSINGAAIAQRAAQSEAVVLLGGLLNARAVAEAVLAEQTRRGARTSVAVIAGGELTAREAGAPVRYAVEDHLGAGAIIAALGDLGLDHCSPEAALAGEGSRALRRATKHLLSASGSGLELAARGQGDEVRAAAELDAFDVVPVLREGVFRAF